MKKQKTTAPAPKKAVSHSGSKKSGSVWSKPWFIAMVLVVVTFVTYLPALQNDWTNWDDYGYVVENNYVQHFSLNSVPEAFKEKQVMGNYHPLSMISLGIDHMLYGNDAKGYHFTAIIAHLANTLLLFWFLLLLFNNILLAGIAALLFAIHPMHVESVAWISERKDVLYVFFFFAAAVTWIKYIKSSNYLWFGITVLLYICSLLAKGQAVTFTVLLVLVDLVLKRRFTLWVIIEKIPFLILSIGFGLLAIKAQQASEAINFIPFYSWTDRLLFASYALFSYIYKFFLPISLSAFHPYPLKNGQPFATIIYLSPVFLAIIAALAVIFLRRLRVAWLGIGFFMANIALVLQLLPVGNAIYAERYTYMSYTGLLIMLAWGVSQLFKQGNKFGIYSKVVFGFVMFLSVFFVVLTQARIKVWNNSEVLWLDVLSKYDYAPNGNNNLGSYYQKHEQLDKAMYYFNNALRLQSDFPEALINRSDVFRIKNKLDSAIADCSHAIRIKPDFDGGYVNRGIALSIAGKYEDALKDFNKAIELNPDNVKPYSNRANLLALKGDFENSLKDYSAVLSRDPNNNDAYGNRARTYFTMKKYDDALNDINAAIKLKGDAPGYYSLRCDIYNMLGNYSAALEDAGRAKELGADINPDFIDMLKQKVK